MKERYLIASALLLLTACSGKVQIGKPTIPYVREIISDHSLPQHALASGYKPQGDAAIYLVGPSEQCIPLLKAFMQSDIYDNVDGRSSNDGLADFAGETICTVSDIANSPYAKFLAEGREDALREVTVRNVLATMDTLCRIGEHDQTGMGRKPASKVVVLPSPYASEFGLYDVDTLFNALGCGLHVVSPLRVMMDRVFSGRKGDAMVGVISTRDNVASGGYSSFVQEVSARHSLTGSDCVVFPSDTSGADPLVSFLNSYMAAGYTRPLDALLVDDYDIDPDAVAVSLSLLTDPSGDLSLTYGNLLARDFMLLDARRAAVEECYRILRSNNLFTHNIAQPKSLEFSTMAIDSVDFTISRYAR
ncbi:MAG: hypothetical protein II095_06875 [Bacteroidales bacterium]|nr:hypothetical protein [Bacteroidales bacterium]